MGSVTNRNAAGGSGAARPGPDADRRALVVIGTRPEAIKLAPVVLALRDAPGWQPIVVTTGQHGPVVDEVLHTFGTPADVALEEWERSGDLAGLHAELVTRLAATVADTAPDTVVVQGDTATTLTGAMAAFWAQIPVVHVEAGLRSGDLFAPFPEEANRRMVAQVAALHLPPTDGAGAALLAEGCDPDRVLVVGNTVVDAVRWLATNGPSLTPAPDTPHAAHNRTLVLVTCHRRENWGDGTRRIATALHDLVREHPGVDVVVAAHPNPAVRAVLDEALAGVDAVSVRDALPYDTFVSLLRRARLVLTDSGGVQEEAAALGVPALVLRDVTERSEGIDAGMAGLVGTDPIAILAGVRRILAEPAPTPDGWPDCPYGDGRAAERTVRAISWLLDGAPRPAPFRYGAAAVTPIG
jgi:UDP-N-acetylglucosamine 2-epimerase (non-hydrolysing)